MANVNDTTTQNTFMKSTGGLDYESLEKRLQERVSQVGKVIGGKEGLQSVRQASNAATSSAASTPSGAWKGGALNTSAYDRTKAGEKDAMMGQVSSQSQAVVQQAKTDYAAQQQAAQGAAMGLELQGASTISQLKHYDTILNAIPEYRAKSAQYWDDAIAYADQTVSAAATRMGQVMDKLDSAISDVGKNLDFARTHALQAQVSGSLGEMRAEERNIQQMYGRESPEYQAFQGAKMQSVHTAASNIHSQFAQLQAQIGASLAQGRAQVAGTMSTLVNYQEKGGVDVRAMRAQQQSSDVLQSTELELKIEELRSHGLDSLISAISSIGGFTFDALPYISMISDLYMEQRTQAV